jgi:hypothetical protein
MDSHHREFDLDDLSGAIDAARQAHGLTWEHLSREIAGVAPSTLRRLTRRRRIETDGVLQVMAWLGRGGLPVVGPGITIRLDARALYAAVEDEKRVRGLTWTSVATEVGVSA